MPTVSTRSSVACFASSVNPLVLLSGTAHRDLADAVAARLGITRGEARLDRFPDGEIHVALVSDVRGRDVFLLQPTVTPAGENLLELLLLADAATRSGAARLTAAIPYFGYARQDRREGESVALGARVLARALGSAGFARYVTVDLHSAAVEACFDAPVDNLSAVPLLAEALRRGLPKNAMVVAPDAGASKLADHFGRLLDLPAAMVHKLRLSGSEVTVTGVTGDVRGRTPILVDDMIATAGTVRAACDALTAAGAAHPFTLVAVHGLFAGAAAETLRTLPLERVIVTDSVPARTSLPFQVDRVALAPLIAETIQRIHSERSGLRPPSG